MTSPVIMCCKQVERPVEVMKMRVREPHVGYQRVAAIHTDANEQQCCHSGLEGQCVVTRHAHVCTQLSKPDVAHPLSHLGRPEPCMMGGVQVWAVGDKLRPCVCASLRPLQGPQSQVKSSQVNQSPFVWRLLVLRCLCMYVCTNGPRLCISVQGQSTSPVD
jgi:hypothetical protein